MGKEYERDFVQRGDLPMFGPMLLYDSIEGNFTWTKGGTGGNDQLVKAALGGFQSAYGMQMTTRTTSAAQYDNVTATMLLGFSNKTQFRVGCIWQHTGAGVLGSFGIDAIFYDGSTKHYTRIRWDADEGAWTYWNAAGTWTTIAGTTMTELVNVWNRIEFDVDLTKGEYRLIKANNKQVSLVGLAYQSVVEAHAPNIELVIRLMNNTAAAINAYVDHIYCKEIG